MSGASPSVLFRLADALEALKEAYRGLYVDEGDVGGEARRALGQVVDDLHVAMALIEPDLDRLAQAFAGVLDDD